MKSHRRFVVPGLALIKDDLMKNLICSLLCFFLIDSVFAFDSWTTHEYGNEIIYRTSGASQLVLGNRGVGIYALTAWTNEPVSIQIDNEPAAEYEIKFLGGFHIFEIVNSKELAKKIKKAKTVSIHRRDCAMSLPYCHFTETFGKKEVVWTFEEPLSTQQKTKAP